MISRKELLEGMLSALWRQIALHPGTIIALGLTLALISALSAVFFLRLNSNQDRLVSPEVPFHKRYLENLKNFGDQEHLYVVIKTGGTEEGKKKAEQFAESLNQRLLQHPDLIQAIYYRILPRDLGDGALLFASPEEAKTLAETVVFLAPALNNWIKNPSLAGFLVQISVLLNSDQRAIPTFDASLLHQAFEALERLLANINNVLAGKPSGSSLFNLAEIGGEYFFTKDGRLLVMRVSPKKDYGTMDVIGKPLEVVRQALKTTSAHFPGLEAGLTGRPVLQADEMQTTEKDMTRASIIAVILVGLLFTVILHGWLRPILLLICLGMAMAWTFGFATVTVGELNLLSIVFVLVLVGIGVDFGVHMVMRYVEAKRGQVGVEEAVLTSMFKTGPCVILGATTSVCAFYSVLGSDFTGLAQLGLIGGTGVLLCLLATLTVLPAMLLIAGRKNLFPSSAPRVTAMPFLERLSARPGWVLLIVVALSLAGLPGLFKARFNYNLLELQAKGLESVEYEEQLIRSSDESTWYAILTADNLDDVKRLAKSLEAMPSVSKVDSILDFIPQEQAQKSALYAKAAKALDDIPVSDFVTTGPDPDSLINALAHLGSVLESLEEKLFAAGAGAELIRIDQCITQIQSSLDILQHDPAKVSRLTVLQAQLRSNIVNTLQQLKRWLNTKSVTAKDLPASIRDVYVGKDGRYQIKVSPSEDVWDFEKLEHFVSDLRRVDPEVSGVPVGVLESARLMHRTFLFAAALTVGLVSLILWFYSYSLRYVLLTLLPLGVSMLWLLELMGMIGLDFNLANFFAIPILIAIGVDGGVHLLARWKELQGSGGLFFTSTPTAVTLSFATTMIGFGGLLFAHHRGLASLGAVMVLGSLMGMVASLLVLPPALKLFGNFISKTKDKG